MNIRKEWKTKEKEQQQARREELEEVIRNADKEMMGSHRRI